MIELDGLTKHYGKFQALDGVDLRVEDGEVFGFLGPNGAGKTTTIKIIAGLIKPSTGEVRLDGVSVQRQPIAAKQRLGIIPDRPFLYEKLTGLEYLRFLCGLYGIDLVEGEVTARKLLELFLLGDWGDELVEGYSHGMKQRLVMAGAFVHRPDVLVIDEPMVGLDPQGTRLVKRIFRSYAARGHSIFLSTHSLPVAQEVCDRIGILSRGKLIAVGSLDELRTRSRNQGDLESVFMTLTREAQVEGAEVLDLYEEGDEDPFADLLPPARGEIQAKAVAESPGDKAGGAA